MKLDNIDYRSQCNTMLGGLWILVLFIIVVVLAVYVYYHDYDQYANFFSPPLNVIAERYENSPIEKFGAIRGKIFGEKLYKNYNYLFFSPETISSFDCEKYHNSRPNDAIYCGTASFRTGERDIYIFSNSIPDKKFIAIKEWKK